MHAEMLFAFMFGLIVHQLITVFYENIMLVFYFLLSTIGLTYFGLSLWIRRLDKIVGFHIQIR